MPWTLWAVNNAPTASDGEVTTRQNTARAFVVSDFGFADVDARDALASVKVTALTGKGTLRLDGTAVTVDRLRRKSHPWSLSVAGQGSARARTR